MYFYYTNSLGERVLTTTNASPTFLSRAAWYLYPEFCCETVQLLNLKLKPKVSYYNTDR